MADGRRLGHRQRERLLEQPLGFLGRLPEIGDRSDRLARARNANLHVGSSHRIDRSPSPTAAIVASAWSARSTRASGRASLPRASSPTTRPAQLPRCTARRERPWEPVARTADVDGIRDRHRRATAPATAASRSPARFPGSRSAAAESERRASRQRGRRGIPALAEKDERALRQGRELLRDELAVQAPRSRGLPPSTAPSRDLT